MLGFFMTLKGRSFDFSTGRAGEPEPGNFGSLEPEPLEKKPGAGAVAAWEKNQGPEPEPEPLKNLPTPQPCR